MAHRNRGGADLLPPLFPTPHEDAPRCAVPARHRDAAVPPATRTETRARSSLRAAGRLRGRLGGPLRLRRSLVPPVPRFGAGRLNPKKTSQRITRKIGTARLSLWRSRLAAASTPPAILAGLAPDRKSTRL